MTVSKEVSLLEVDKELQGSKEFLKSLGIRISEVDNEKLLFTAYMTSSIDDEVYELELRFDNYPGWPPLIEFIHPETRERGTKKAYPKKEGDSFFHPYPCICNPCSRKAYKTYDPNAPHGDWDLMGWRTNAQYSTLKTIDAILIAINSRINNPRYYDGRMEK